MNQFQKIKQHNQEKKFHIFVDDRFATTDNQSEMIYSIKFKECVSFKKNEERR